MLIELTKIHGAPKPVRESWNEEKMLELETSIRDLGVIVPIKVRPNEDGYEVVYGHRRAEAARRVGLSHIPAEIETMDDGASVKQAIVENVVREDMTELEKARAYKRLRDEYAMNDGTIGDFVGLSDKRISQYITLANDAILDYVNFSSSRSIHNIPNLASKAQATRLLGDLDDRIAVLQIAGEGHFSRVATVAQAIRPLPKADRQLVLDKAKAERLEPEHIERLAKTVYQANQENKPLLKQSALAIRGDAGMYDDMVRTRAGMFAHIERNDERMRQRKEAEIKDYDELVKDGIRYIRTLLEWVTEYAYEGIEQGKFSPEAARYVTKRFDGLVEEYTNRLRPTLDNVKE